LKIAGKEPLILNRDQAYLGVLIDDLVTKGTDEPYRMFTSRAEYRLLLRQDNADRRLTPLADRCGLIDSVRRERLARHESDIQRSTEFITSRRSEGILLSDWLKRPEVTWEILCEREPELKGMEISPLATEQVVIETKYAGYIARQSVDIEKQRKVQSLNIPDWFDYSICTQLRHEARDKLSRIKPRNIGQASRVSGITPSDLAVLTMYVKNPGKTELKS
jgi:tRNA uridine 5-carboxymethylaminomethyl modification enzyme